ncbi:MAG TPA: flavodoxin family protein [Symbiobacteriaceae bacterium]|nr:flavodoxin family protein [Symbiobacteriaceae bacterium]
MKILVLYGSSRRNGNSEALADYLTRGVACSRVYLAEKQITPIVDQRHTPGGFDPVDDDHDKIIDQMLAHDIIIFATPLYWYGMSGQMKLFVDRWSQSLRDKRIEFKNGMAGKKAYVVITGGDNPRIKGLPLVQQFQYIFGFMGMEFAGYLLGKGGQPGEVLQDERVLAEANLLRRDWQ